MATKEERVSTMKNIKEKIISATQKEISLHDVNQPSKLLGNVDCVEIPCLEEIDFYQGYRAPEYDYAPQSVKISHMFNSQKNLKHSVELPKVLHKFKQGQITFIGPAGSGKTTLLKCLAHDIIAGKYPSLADVDYVHFLQGRNLCLDAESTPAELLFNACGNVLNDEEVEEYVWFVRMHPNQVIFIIDSLDTLPYDLENEAKAMKFHDSGPPGRILWNLLTGNFFPRCRIVTSSREHKIRNFHGRLRAEHVIALTGLSEESIRRIIVRYLGKEKGENIVRHLETKSPALMTLCGTPVFLSYTLMGFEDSDFTEHPSTMSGIMVSLLRSLICSKHAHVFNIEDVIHKLARLSFYGSKDGKVVFRVSLLAEYGLSEGEVTDLTVLAPGGRPHKLLQYENVLFFCHQSIQEALSAFHIAQMPHELFESFVNEYLHTSHYAVIRRILCGILLDEKVFKASTMLLDMNRGLGQKQVILKQSLKNELNQVMRGVDELEFIISLNEARDGANDIIMSSMTDLDVQELPLLRSDIQAVGSVLSRGTRFNRVSLRKCSLGPENLNILLLAVQNSNIQIFELNLWGNDNMGTDGTKCIGQIARCTRVKWLGLGYCNLLPDELQSFKNSIGDYEMSKLVLWANKNIGVEGMSILGQIVKDCRVKHLCIGDCNLEPDHLFAFVESAGKSELRELDLRYNVNLGSEGMSALGQLVQQSELQSLNIGECGLTEKQLIKLGQSTGEAKILKLNFQGNRTMGIGGLSVVGKIAKQNMVESLSLGYLDLRSAQLSALEESLHGCKISEISLYENKNMGADGISVVGWITKDCQVCSLDLTNCNLMSEHLLALEKTAAGANLSQLNLHDNESIGSDGMPVVGRIVAKCGVKILDLSDCALTLPHLEAFANSLQGVKCQLQVADLGVSVLSCTKVADHEEVSELVRLFPHVRQELKLGRWKIKDDDRDLLQQELEKTENSGLKILFSHDDILTSSCMDSDETENAEKESLPFDSEESPTVDQEDSETLFIPYRLPTTSKTEVVIEQKIGPEGGVVEIDGCTITFQPGTVDEIILFRFSLVLGKKTCPSGFVGVTPRLDCMPSMTFKLPVKISLKTWCSTSCAKVMVSVMYQNNNSENLHTIQTMALIDVKDSIEFECNHFTSFWALVRSFFLGEMEYKLLPELFYDLQGNFTMAFHFDNTTAAKKCSGQLLDHNFEPAPVAFNAMVLKMAHRATVGLRCQNDGRYIFEPEEQHFVMERSVVEDTFVYLHFLLGKPPQPDDLLKLLCQIQNKNVMFNLLWPKPVQAVFAGDVQADSIIVAHSVHLRSVDGRREEYHGISSVYMFGFVVLCSFLLYFTLKYFDLWH